MQQRDGKFHIKPVVFSILLMFLMTEVGASPPVSRWKTKNLGPTLNTAYHEAFSTITPNERTIYFSSNRPGGYGPADPNVPWPLASYDIYVAHRPSKYSPWGQPILLGPNINTSSSEHSVSISPDGHFMFFASNRPGGCGGFDIHVSYRTNKYDDFGWGPAINLGCTVNTPYIDSCPSITVDDDGNIKLYFVQSNLDSPPGDFQDQLDSLDFMISTWDPQANQFGAPVVFELSTPYQDSHFEPMNGYIWGAYPMGYGGGDIWVSLERDGELTPPINLGPDVNTPYEEQIPSSSKDGKRLYFASDRPGGFGGVDLYMSRSRLKKKYY